MGNNRLPPGYFVFPRNGQYLVDNGAYIIDQQWVTNRLGKAAKKLDYFM